MFWFVNSMKKALGFALCLLGTAFLILWGMLWSLEYVGTDPELYRRLQFEARSDILEYAGISEEDLVRVNEALADCLQGDQNVLENLEAEVFGKTQPAFNARELTHMEDCRKLFELARRVKDTVKVLGPLAVIGGFVLLKDRKKIILSACLGPLVLVLPLGALAAWAAADFNAAFNFFHEVLFTNDLWLLDPDTDLLIRICPQKMFMNMGLRIGAMSLIFAFAAPAVLILTGLALHKRKLIDNGDVK
ncbi:MAG: TIGR01906 family membrane protein [Clostridia bacterium]|nr:TIGR01906 family membrane protein [Clostridia bacterium]